MRIVNFINLIRVIVITLFSPNSVLAESSLIPDYSKYRYGFSEDTKKHVDIEQKWPNKIQLPNDLFEWLSMQERKEWLSDESRLISSLAHIPKSNQQSVIGMLEASDRVNLKIFHPLSDNSDRVAAFLSLIEQKNGRHHYCVPKLQLLIENLKNSPISQSYQDDSSSFPLRDLVSKVCPVDMFNNPGYSTPINGRYRAFSARTKNFVALDSKQIYQKSRPIDVEDFPLAIRADYNCPPSPSANNITDMESCFPVSFYYFFDLKNCSFSAGFPIEPEILYPDIGFGGSVIGRIAGETYVISLNITFFPRQLDTSPIISVINAQKSTQQLPSQSICE